MTKEKDRLHRTRAKQERGATGSGEDPLHETRRRSLRTYKYLNILAKNDILRRLGINPRHPNRLERKNHKHLKNRNA